MGDTSPGEYSEIERLRIINESYDKSKETAYGEIQAAVPVIIEKLNELGAREITTEEITYQDTRMKVLGSPKSFDPETSREPDTRKKVLIKFFIEDEEYEFIGRIITPPSITALFVDDNYKYVTDWAMYTVATDKKQGEGVGVAYNYLFLLDHLKDWIGGERKYKTLD